MAQSELELCNSALSKLGCRVKLTTVSTTGTTQEERACASRVDICKRTVLAMHPWNFAIKRTNLEPIWATISNCTNNGGAIRVTTTLNHIFSTGDRVTIRDVVGTVEANGTWYVTKHSNNQIDLIDSVFTNAYVSGGEVTHSGLFDYTYHVPLPADCLRILRVNDQLLSPDWRIEKGHILTNDDTNYVKYIYDADIDDTMSILFYEALALYLAWDISLELGRDNQTKEQLGRDFKEVLAKARFVDAMEDPAEQIEASDWLSSRFTYRGANSDPRYW